MKLKFVGQFQIASLTSYIRFDTKKVLNNGAINFSYSAMYQSIPRVTTFPPRQPPGKSLKTAKSRPGPGFPGTPYFDKFHTFSPFSRP